MKKILYLCLACVFVSEFCVANTNFKNRNEEFIVGFVQSTENFFKKLETCTPTETIYESKQGKVKMQIHGITKNGKCHYADAIYFRGEYTPLQCIVPMQVAIALSTTAIDSVDKNFEQVSPNIRAERKKQFLEIYKLAQDYCNYDPIIKKYSSYLAQEKNKNKNNARR